MRTSLLDQSCIIARVASLIVIQAIVLQPFAPAQAQTEQLFKIPANTIIRVRTIEDVSSETARVGGSWVIAVSRERQWRCRCAFLAPMTEAGSSQRT